MKGCPFCEDFIEDSNTNPKSFLYAPDRDYMELTEAVDIVKKHRKKVGIV